jgi:hypothetical protein
MVQLVAKPGELAWNGAYNPLAKIFLTKNANKRLDSVIPTGIVTTRSMRTYIHTSVEKQGGKAPQGSLCSLCLLMSAPESYFGIRNWDATWAGRW